MNFKSLCLVVELHPHTTVCNRPIRFPSRFQLSIRSRCRDFVVPPCPPTCERWGGDMSPPQLLWRRRPCPSGLSTPLGSISTYIIYQIGTALDYGASSDQTIRVDYFCLLSDAISCSHDDRDNFCTFYTYRLYWHYRAYTTKKS